MLFSRRYGFLVDVKSVCDHTLRCLAYEKFDRKLRIVVREVQFAAPVYEFSLGASVGAERLFGDCLIIKRDQLRVRLCDQFVFLCFILHTAYARAHERDNVKKQYNKQILLAENVRDYKPDHDGTVR